LSTLSTSSPLMKGAVCSEHFDLLKSMKISVVLDVFRSSLLPQVPDLFSVDCFIIIQNKLYKFNNDVAGGWMGQRSCEEGVQVGLSTYPCSVPAFRMRVKEMWSLILGQLLRKFRIQVHSEPPRPSLLSVVISLRDTAAQKAELKSTNSILT
ncbi:hypothetical protein XENOCAPTIV_012898, partial [Xenoophorus captivus]